MIAARLSHLGATTIDGLYVKVLYFYLVFFNIHYTYRYLFKYNAETTSPTYSNTPAYLQVFKYIVFAAVAYSLILYFFSKPKLRIAKSSWLFFTAFGFLVVNASITGNIASTDFIKAYMLPILPFILLFFIPLPNHAYGTFRKILSFTIFYHLIYSLIQILLFITVGRLPALAYAGTYLVRFGGGLDDPNGFAPIIFPCCLYFFDRMYYSGFTKWRLGLLLLSSVLFLWTQSFTAFITSIPILFGYLLLRKSYKLTAILFGLVIIIGAVVVNSPIMQILTTIIEMKSGSIDAHFVWTWDDVLTQHWFNFLFGAMGSHQVPFFECDFIFIFFNYGLIGLGLLATLWATATCNLITYYRFTKNESLKSLMIACLAFLAIFFLGCWNLPYFRLIPISVNYWFAICVLLSQHHNILRFLTSGYVGSDIGPAPLSWRTNR